MIYSTVFNNISKNDVNVTGLGHPKFYISLFYRDWKSVNFIQFILSGKWCFTGE